MGQLTRNLNRSGQRGSRCWGSSRTLVLSTIDPSSLRSGSQTYDSTDRSRSRSPVRSRTPLDDRLAIKYVRSAGATQADKRELDRSASPGFPTGPDGSRTAAIDAGPRSRLQFDHGTHHWPRAYEASNKPSPTAYGARGCTTRRLELCVDPTRSVVFVRVGLTSNPHLG